MFLLFFKINVNRKMTNLLWQSGIELPEGLKAEDSLQLGKTEKTEFPNVQLTIPTSSEVEKWIFRTRTTSRLCSARGRSCASSWCRRQRLPGEGLPPEGGGRGGSPSLVGVARVPLRTGPSRRPIFSVLPERWSAEKKLLNLMTIV